MGSVLLFLRLLFLRGLIPTRSGEGRHLHLGGDVPSDGSPFLGTLAVTFEVGEGIRRIARALSLAGEIDPEGRALIANIKMDEG